MLSLDRRMSFEVEFNQVAIAVADMLARQMDDVFLGLVQDAGTDRHDSNHRTAEAANRIVVLCRRLADEIRRYQHCDQVRREVDEENFPF
jgi:hypothetical protein